MISPRAVVSITIIVTVFTSILAPILITILITILVTILIPTLVNIIINNVTFFFIVVVNILPLIVLTQAACCPFIPSLECSGNPALLKSAVVGAENLGRAVDDLAQAGARHAHDSTASASPSHSPRPPPPSSAAHLLLHPWHIQLEGAP